MVRSCLLVGLKIYFNEGECILVKPIDQEDCIEIMERLRVVTPGCEVRLPFYREVVSPHLLV